ncbi:MAG: hypothetical protein LC730_06025 [Acidobacteria bacterium]|nr:hypothetical protein [Acidobacteriota bacterium]
MGHLPKRCYFANAGEVENFQRVLKVSRSSMDGAEIVLDAAAMKSLLNARAEAERLNLKLTPLDGSIAATRSFYDTVRLWNARVLPALRSWTATGRISQQDADAIVESALIPQVEKVIKLERDGLCFAPDRRRSIFTSAAPPGTSQHLLMLAFDIVQHGDRRVVAILNRHGWYQTILGDPAHFTFLGEEERELPARGLRFLYSGNHAYWVPNLASNPSCRSND